MPKRSINKSAFVREMGSMPATEIVKKAKQRGITLKLQHVYNVRSANRKKSTSAGHVARRPGRPPKARASTTLRATLDRLTKKFVDEILSALKRASLQEMFGK